MGPTCTKEDTTFLVHLNETREANLFASWMYAADEISEVIEKHWPAIEVLVKEGLKAVVEHLRIGPISIIPHPKFDTKFSPWRSGPCIPHI